MASDELLMRISQRSARGESEEQIRSSLERAGYSSADINGALAIVRLRTSLPGAGMFVSAQEPATRYGSSVGSFFFTTLMVLFITAPIAYGLYQVQTGSINFNSAATSTTSKLTSVFGIVPLIPVEGTAPGTTNTGKGTVATTHVTQSSASYTTSNNSAPVATQQPTSQSVSQAPTQATIIPGVVPDTVPTQTPVPQPTPAPTPAPIPDPTPTPAGNVATSSASLLALLKVAHGGDTIQLAPGYYSNLTLQNYNFSSPVTLTSQNAAHQAVFTNFNVLRTTGLTFQNVELSSDPSIPGVSSTGLADPYPFRVTNSNQVTFTNVYVHGSLDNDPTNDHTGIYLSGSNNVSITNSVFQEVGYGIVDSLSTNVLISNNYFHEVRADGIHGGSSNVQITRNYFADFHPVSGDHPDAIQFFNETSGTAPHDIDIENNVAQRGSGAAIEGIFMRLPDNSTTKFTNVTIKDNLLLGTMYDGITLLGGQNATIANNVVGSYADQAARIWIGNSDSVSSTNNQSYKYIYGSLIDANTTAPGNNTNFTESGNTTIPVVTDNGSALLHQWVSTHVSIPIPSSALSLAPAPSRVHTNLLADALTAYSEAYIFFSHLFVFLH